MSSEGRPLYQKLQRHVLKGIATRLDRTPAAPIHSDTSDHSDHSDHFDTFDHSDTSDHSDHSDKASLERKRNRPMIRPVRLVCTVER